MNELADLWPLGLLLVILGTVVLLVQRRAEVRERCAWRRGNHG